MSAIEVQALVKSWDGFRAVDDVSFSVPEGSLTVALLGLLALLALAQFFVLDKRTHYR